MSATDSTGSSSSTGDGHSTNTGETPPASGWSDRVLGVICVVVAIWYTIEARTFDVTAFGSGPVGPKTLPTAVGVLFAGLGLYLIIKPDENPRWPSARASWQLGVVVLCSYLYGRVMEPIGFIAASALMTLVIGLLFRAPIKRLVPAAVIFPVVLAYLFNNWLELRLPVGWWGGY